MKYFIHCFCSTATIRKYLYISQNLTFDLIRKFYSCERQSIKKFLFKNHTFVEIIITDSINFLAVFRVFQSRHNISYPLSQYHVLLFATYTLSISRLTHIAICLTMQLLWECRKSVLSDWPKPEFNSDLKLRTDH